MQALGGAKNHMVVMPDADMDKAADALMGAGYGSAGERCMAVSVAVPVGEKTANDLVAKLAPRVAALKIGPSTDSDAEMGPLVTRQHMEKVLGYIESGVEEGAELVVDGRGFSLQGYEDGYFVGGTLGSFSDGFRMKQLPQATATANIHIGTMAGKLNGVMPAHTPSGWRSV